MSLWRLSAPVLVAVFLFNPVSVFAQRRSSGYPSTAVGGSTFRALTGPPVVTTSNPPLYNSNSYPYPLVGPTYYPTGLSVPLVPRFPSGPMAGAGDTDASVRENTPEDESILRAFRPQSANSAPMPVFQPRPDTDLWTAVETNMPATVVVHVPADAQVWFDNSPTRSTGSERSFETPALTSGKTYRYTLKARWLQDGKPVEASRGVEVRPGERSVVNFDVPRP